MKAMFIYLVRPYTGRWSAEDHVVLASNPIEARKTAGFKKHIDDQPTGTENLLAVMVPDDTPPRVLHISYMDYT